MGLPELLQSLSSEGQIHSQGAFTVSFDQAQEKLTEYQMSDPTRFLVPIVAGAVGLNATMIRIEATETQVSVELEGLCLSADDLASHLYGLINAPDSSPGQDLAFGLLGAFNYCPLGLEIISGDVEQESYRWKIGTPPESRQVLEQAVTSTTIIASKSPDTALRKLRRWLGGLGGYTDMTPECRWVDRLCEHAPIPIWINEQPVTRAYMVPKGSGQLQLGSTPTVHFSNRDFLLSNTESEFQAGLALKSGKVRIVRRGVSYPGPIDLDLEGLIHCDHFRLDLSREHVVRDASYQKLVTQLHRMRLRLIREVVENWRNVHTGMKQRLMGLLWESIQERKLDEATLAEAQRIWKTGSNYRQSIAGLVELKADSADLGFSILAQLFEESGLSLDLVILACRFAQFQGADDVLEWLKFEAWLATADSQVNQSVRLRRIVEQVRSHQPKDKALLAKLILLSHYHLGQVAPASQKVEMLQEAVSLATETGGSHDWFGELFKEGEHNPGKGFKRVRAALAKELGDPHVVWERLMEKRTVWGQGGPFL